MYIYFYFHGLSLLNEKGSFCFITSNSWLDVGYGKDLQEFLLKHGHVKFVLDNQVKRSFAAADVNTIIALFSRPEDNRQDGLKNTARFVMFKAPFEQIVSPVIFEEIEDAGNRKSRDEYRAFPVNQEALLKDGCEMPEEPARKLAGGEEEPATTKRKSSKTRALPTIKVAKYIGNKWGGKYLRAPDIYWTILKKGKGKLVRLGDVAEVRFGIKTGANEFFYLDEAKIEKWGIEEEFLQPVIKSPRECKSIQIRPRQLKFKLFMCHRDKSELKGSTALRYIRWGESKLFHEVPSVRGRRRWWDLGSRRIPPIISPSSVSEFHRTFRNHSVLADKRLYEIYPSTEVDLVLLSTNAITTTLFLELGSRTGLGEGLLDLAVYELAGCLIVLPQDKGLAKVIEQARSREFLSLRDEFLHPNRIELDSAIFDALELTQGEREAVYEAVIDLVEKRLGKAKSV